MKKLIFVFILSLICTFHIKGQIVEKNDTLYLYFYKQRGNSEVTIKV